MIYQNKTETLGKTITENEMGWYNQLWEYDDKENVYNRMNVDGDDKRKVIEDVMQVKPRYASFAEFKRENGLNISC